MRPNYAKSHLYLGLLYRQKRKFGLALEHLKFAGADKVVREVEAEMHPQERTTQKVPALKEPPVAPPPPAATVPGKAPAPQPDDQPPREGFVTRRAKTREEAGAGAEAPIGSSKRKVWPS